MVAVKKGGLLEVETFYAKSAREENAAKTEKRGDCEHLIKTEDMVSKRFLFASEPRCNSLEDEGRDCGTQKIVVCVNG